MRPESTAGRPENASDDDTARQGVPVGAVSDLPAQTDLLGVAPLVEGLRALLNARRTDLPLAIAISGAWGAGKSSVMLQLRKLLREPGDRRPQERRWRTVEFPAWKYEGGERFWAALAKAIYEQPQAQMSLRERVGFRIRVERERLGWRRFLLKGIWPPLAALLATAVALGSDLDPGGSTPLIGAALSLSAFSAGAARYWGVASMPFKRAVERHSGAPDYEEKVGFTSEADRDIASLTRVLTPDTVDDPYALAVFVDDLDRCSSAYIVEVLEAMSQIFNSDGRDGCVFLLGLDPQVISASLDVAYAATAESLRERGSSISDFSAEFLTKLVQISVAVPRPGQEALTEFLYAINGAERLGGVREAEGEALARVEERIRERVPEGLAGLAEAAAGIDATPEAVELGERRVRAGRFGDSSDVIEAEFAVLPHLGPQPTPDQALPQRLSPTDLYRQRGPLVRPGLQSRPAGRPCPLGRVEAVPARPRQRADQRTAAPGSARGQRQRVPAANGHEHGRRDPCKERQVLRRRAGRPVPPRRASFKGATGEHASRGIVFGDRIAESAAGTEAPER